MMFMFQIPAKQLRGPFKDQIQISKLILLIFFIKGKKYFSLLEKYRFQKLKFLIFVVRINIRIVASIRELEIIIQIVSMI